MHLTQRGELFFEEPILSDDELSLADCTEVVTTLATRLDQSRVYQQPKRGSVSLVLRERS